MSSSGKRDRAGAIGKMNHEFTQGRAQGSWYRCLQMNMKKTDNSSKIYISITKKKRIQAWYVRNTTKELLQ